MSEVSPQLFLTLVISTSDKGVPLENWVNVPTNSVLTIHNQTVMVHPIIDQYYDRSPYHVRSSAFAETKGLATNEKALTTPLATTVGSPGEVELVKRFLGPIIPFGVSRSRTPEASSLPKARIVVPVAPSPSDIRSVTSPPPTVRSTPPPVQGNIKKKRASLVAAEPTFGGGGPLPPDSDQESTTPELPRTEFGNPNKIAQFFPELRLSQ